MRMRNKLFKNYNVKLNINLKKVYHLFPLIIYKEYFLTF